jgi:hypothetical protein
MSIREIIEKKKSVVETDAYVVAYKYGDVGKEEAKLILQYAKEKYGLLANDGECLDSKADLLVKYLGLVPPALTALIGYLGPGSRCHFHLLELFGIGAGITTWLVALYMALQAARPGDMPYPPTIKNLLQDMKDGRPAEMVLALKYEQSVARIKELGNMKGNKLKWGYGLMAASILLLLLSLIGGRL